MTSEVEAENPSHWTAREFTQAISSHFKICLQTLEERHRFILNLDSLNSERGVLLVLGEVLFQANQVPLSDTFPLAFI